MTEIKYRIEAHFSKVRLFEARVWATEYKKKFVFIFVWFEFILYKAAEISDKCVHFWTRCDCFVCWV